MKKMFAAFFALLLAMAALPAAVVSGLKGYGSPLAGASPDSAQEVIDSAAALCPEDACDEMLRAALIIAQTNLRASYAQKGVFSSNKELYKQLKGKYHSTEELYLQRDGKNCSIPCAEISDGITEDSRDFPQLSPVASPWDRLNSHADDRAACAGVSLRGVNYLCEQGYSAEQALCYYLPDFTLSAHRK